MLSPSTTVSNGGKDMKVLVVDDHTIIRRGVRNLLEMTYPQIQVEEARSIVEVERALAAQEFDLIILDLLLADGNAFDHVGAWARSAKDTSILVYSMCSEHLYAKRLAALGCRGFLSKEEPEESLLIQVEALRVGRTMIASETEEQVIETADATPFAKLSDREIRVMEELLRGLGIKEIAQRLDLGPSTVATYKSRLYDKLGVTNELQLRRLSEIHGVFRS